MRKICSVILFCFASAGTMSAQNLNWATYFGGPAASSMGGHEIRETVATDDSGNVYLAGETQSASNIATPGAHKTTNPVGADCFLAKFNKNRTLIWATYFGGDWDERNGSVAVDRQGNVYLTGIAGSANGIATPGAHKDTTTTVDALLAKFNSSGTLLWGTYFGGNDYDGGNAIAVDTAGNVYLAGSTSSTSGLSTAGAYQTTLKGTTDAFLAKFHGDGTLEWSTYLGSNGTEGITSVTCDKAGNIYFTGETSSSSGLATAGAHQPGFGGGSTDGFIGKITNTGNVQWLSYFGGSAIDVANGVACDVAGNVYVTGGAQSSSGIATAGSHQSVYGGGGPSTSGWYLGDAFLAKFAPAGNIIWSTYYGGGEDEAGTGTTVDALGNVYITGITSSSSGIATAGAFKSNFTTASTGLHSDAFLAWFSNTGTLLYGTYFGGDQFELGYSVTVDNNGLIYITGQTQSINGIATPGVHQTAPADGVSSDAYLAQFTRDGTFANTVHKTQPEVNLFPNPSSSDISLASAGNIGEVTIVNVSGQVIYRKQFTSQQAHINVAHLPPGTYIVNINGKLVKKFIKE